ncbi:GFA family protein [soil metagenome]
MTGGCLCGAVRYRIDGPLRPVVACHCTQCRRTSGHHVAATAAPREAVAVEGTVSWFASSLGVRRGFCAVCGSNLFWDDSARPHLSIWAGSLDGPTGLRLTHHIFVAEKGDYYDIADGLPQHAGSGGG